MSIIQEGIILGFTMALRPVEEENEEVQRDCSVTLEHFCNEYFHSLKQKKAAMKDTVYYLPGMGGRLNTGLGKGIHDRGYKVVGRETRGEFQKYSFQDKIDLVANDLEQHFWYKKAKVVVNSFGAYLFLHAQLQMKPYPGSVLILSPIIGGSKHDETQMRFYPPRADALVEAAASGEVPCPLNAAVHLGSEDWQSGPDGVLSFGRAVGVPVSVVDGQGHMLSVDYVGSLLDEQLMRPTNS